MQKLTLGMNPENHHYALGELVVSTNDGSFEVMPQDSKIEQSEYTMFRLPQQEPDEMPTYAFHHSSNGMLKLYVRKLSIQHGLRISLKTVIGESYTIRYKLERERVLGTDEAISAPVAVTRVTGDEKGIDVITENQHKTTISSTTQEIGSITFTAKSLNSYLFLLAETLDLQSGLSWVTFQEVETDADTDQTAMLEVDPFYLEPNEWITGIYTGELSQAQLYVNGIKRSVGGEFKNGQLRYYVPSLSLYEGDQALLVCLDTSKQVQAIVHIPLLKLGSFDIQPFAIELDTKITGQYENTNPSKARLIINGVEKAIGGTFKNGQFSIDVASGLIQLNDTVTLSFYDVNGRLLETKSVYCYVGHILTAHYGFGRSTIEGTYEGTVQKLKLVKETIDGTQTVVGWGGTLFPNETPHRFSFWVNASLLKEDDTLWLTPHNEKDQALDDPFPVVIEKATMVIDPYYPEDINITGRYTGPVRGAYLYTTGSSQPVRSGGTFNTDGTFRFYAAGLDLTKEPVTMIPYNNNGKPLSVAQPVKIRKGKLTPNSYVLGTTSISGNYSGEITKARLQVNNDPLKISWGGTFENGVFSYYINANWVTSVTDTITLTGYSSSSEIIDGPIVIPIQKADSVKKTSQLVQIDLAEIIKDAVTAGEETVYLKPASEVVYTLGGQGAESLPTDLNINLIGQLDEQNNPLSEIKMLYKDSGKQSAKYMISFKENIENVTMKGIYFNLAEIGRGGLKFVSGNNIRIQYCKFGGYDPSVGHEKTDSNIVLVGCQNVWIEDNEFENNKGTNADAELNRCITIQEKDFNNSYSENIYIRRNSFQSVCQGVVISTKKLYHFQVHQNYFEKLGDNAIYALQLQAGSITENTFYNLADEALVLGAGKGFVNDPVKAMKFEVIGNISQDVNVKFIGINGSMEELAILGNEIVNQKMVENRPAAIAWRPNTDAGLVKRLLINGNRFDLDTHPANFDVFPLGSASDVQFKENRLILEGLASFQKVFTFTGGMAQREKNSDGSIAGYLLEQPIPMNTLLVLRNIWSVREGGVIQPDAILLRDNQNRLEDNGTVRWWTVPIKDALVIWGPNFPAKYFQNDQVDVVYEFFTYY
jgi:hypothetical protein